MREIWKRFIAWLHAKFHKTPVEGHRLVERHRGGKQPNSPGSKVARRFAKHSGLLWCGEVYHTGELTKLNNERRARRASQVN